jgi:CHAP domain
MLGCVSIPCDCFEENRRRALVGLGEFAQPHNFLSSSCKEAEAMDISLGHGDSGQEVALLVDDLRAIGLSLPRGDRFSEQVAAALKVFQQSHHDHWGEPLKIDGRLDPLTALALDVARGRAHVRQRFSDGELPRMSIGGSTIARQAATIAASEYMRGSGEQGGDNLGADILRYNGSTAQTGLGWSTHFAIWCYKKAVAHAYSPLGNANNSRDLYDQSAKKDWTLSDLSQGLLPGDLVVWKHAQMCETSPDIWGGHVGIVWHVADRIVTTLEGNRGSYPSLVRPYRHNSFELCHPLTGQLPADVGIIRVPVAH